MFIKGEPVPVPSPSAPMVIEFWASWCGPCRVAFPHLSQLARKYRDSAGLVVVGVNIEGDSPAVRALVQQQGANMDYTVAVDVGEQASTKLMGAAGVSGIPCAFVVDTGGVIRHHGHPMEPAFAQAVEQVCRGAAGRGAAPQPAPQRVQRQPVTKTREELLASPVRELKAALDDWGVGYADLNEKGELVERVLERCKAVR